MGTMAFSTDTMDEVASQLAVAFGAGADQGSRHIPTAGLGLLTELSQSSLQVAACLRALSSRVAGEGICPRGSRTLSLH
jgi:hypothetical protein